jgi:hypothetical protein
LVSSRLARIILSLSGRTRGRKKNLECTAGDADGTDRPGMGPGRMTMTPMAKDTKFMMATCGSKHTIALDTLG